MSEPKWTPGPWRIARSDPAEGFDVWWLCAGEGDMETELGSFPGGYPHDRKEANARLVAAAPELYTQLKDAITTLEESAKILAKDWPSFANNIVNQCAIRCGDVLAKARGE